MELAIQALASDVTTSFAYNKVLMEDYPKLLEQTKELYISTAYKA